MILLGKHITVTSAKNSELVGVAGTVTEDNMHTLRVATPRGEKLLVKSTITIQVEGRTLESKDLKGMHAARIKK